MKRLMGVCFIVLLAVVFFGPGTALAPITWYVGSEPNDHFTTIQAALSDINVFDGDTINEMEKDGKKLDEKVSVLKDPAKTGSKANKSQEQSR